MNMNDIKKIIKDDNFTITCDGLFGVLRVKNTELLELSNKTYNVSFLDAIDFSITSNGLSIIKSYFYETVRSYSTILLMRNIIEDFALKEMYLKGDIPIESIELLKYNGFIEDYKQYKDFKGPEYKKFIDYSKMLEDYKGALSVYNKYGIKEKDIIKMDIPFILKKKTTYLELIDKYLPTFKQFYKLLSFYVHPHNYGTEGSDDNVDLVFANIVYQLLGYYKDDLVNAKAINSFSVEKNLLLSLMIDAPDNYSLHFLNYCIEENVLITDLRDLVEKALGENNYIKHLLDVLPGIVYDICTDSIHGQSENCKMKFKTIIELFSVYDWLYFSEEYDEKHFKLLNYYSAIKENDAYDYPYEENYKEAFEVFQKLYPNCNDYDKFRITFGKTLGFTIDGNYNKMSLNDIINQYIEKNYRGAKALDGMNMTVLFSVLYSEACSIGHGKAYSFFANTGAFMEDINVVLLTDYMIRNFFFKYNIYFKTFDVEKKYGELEEKIELFANKINEIANKKVELMRLKITKFDFKTMRYK